MNSTELKGLILRKCHSYNEKGWIRELCNGNVKVSSRLTVDEKNLVLDQVKYFVEDTKYLCYRSIAYGWGISESTLRNIRNTKYSKVIIQSTYVSPKKGDPPILYIKPSALDSPSDISGISEYDTMEGVVDQDLISRMRRFNFDIDPEECYVHVKDELRAKNDYKRKETRINACEDIIQYEAVELDDEN